MVYLSQSRLSNWMPEIYSMACIVVDLDLLVKKYHLDKKLVIMIPRDISE